MLQQRAHGARNNFTDARFVALALQQQVVRGTQRRQPLLQPLAHFLTREVAGKALAGDGLKNRQRVLDAVTQFLVGDPQLAFGANFSCGFKHRVEKPDNLPPFIADRAVAKREIGIFRTIPALDRKRKIFHERRLAGQRARYHRFKLVPDFGPDLLERTPQRMGLLAKYGNKGAVGQADHVAAPHDAFGKVRGKSKADRGLERRWPGLGFAQRRCAPVAFDDGVPHRSASVKEA